ncbi:MAG: GNAT family N-acetyltransferase [Deltaproteobacteria bacterium]|nr:GNAT family N-acetyltransferase [Deltaproteobacteria bacterium]
MVQIIDAQTPQHYQCARDLFLEYAACLGVDLEFQGFSQELTAFPGDYAPPHGCILLAEISGYYAGCVALRPLEGKICEMKRLFVVPEYQGGGIGRTLARSLIDRAREKGYEKMRLDTIDSMKTAKRLYFSLNFRTIEAYRYNPLNNPSYLELDL